MRQEIHEGLQVVGNWNSANKDLFYSKDGDLAGTDKESQEVSVLALHLLQSALVHVNTLLVQEVLADPKWADKLTDADRRAVSPLFWAHVEPCGRFELDMNSRLDLDLSLRAAIPGPRTPQGEEAAGPARHPGSGEARPGTGRRIPTGKPECCIRRLGRGVALREDLRRPIC
ncbi:Tn3 family transposase [Streptomyces sp. CAI-85]|uniref:Tn3 family transposase n=1 Tax=Streptomyces sp. CAI-85 TaxID=1472662 RepID=UPI001C31ACC2|nr:Tn3 family transposase [Streptomyces sp. CAI-85]